MNVTRRSLATTPFLNLGLILLMLSLALPVAYAQSGLNLVYVESNIGSVSNANSVLGWSNDGLGNLTPLPGSPYLTGGTGVFFSGGGSPAFDADQQVVISPSGTKLLAVNGHSNSVAVFNINSDGSLTPVAGSPFASNGADPASIALKPGALLSGLDLIVVVNKNSDPAQNGNTNYTSFSMDTNGNMAMMSSMAVSSTASPSQAVFFPTQVKLIGDEFMAPTVTTYKVKRSDGSFTQLSQLGPPTPGAALLGIVHHPKLRLFFIGLPTINQIAVYRYDAPGNLSLVGTVSNDGLAVCWLAINAAGTRLYSAESTSGTVSVYDSSNPRALVELQHMTLKGKFPNPVNLHLDPTEKFLYVLDNSDTTPALHVLNVASDGTLSETTTPVSIVEGAGEEPMGVAVLMK